MAGTAQEFSLEMVGIYCIFKLFKKKETQARDTDQLRNLCSFSRQLCREIKSKMHFEVNELKIIAEEID